MSGSHFYEWLFGAGNVSGHSKNVPLSFLRSLPTNTKVFFRFMSIWKKKILARAIRIQKETGGGGEVTKNFSEIIELKLGKK